MEDTHWVKAVRVNIILQSVLILVVMEDTHWENGGNTEKYQRKRLNPCCNGRYSLSN